VKPSLSQRPGGNTRHSLPARGGRPVGHHGGEARGRKRGAGAVVRSLSVFWKKIANGRVAITHPRSQRRCGWSRPSTGVPVGRIGLSDRQAGSAAGLVRRNLSLPRRASANRRPNSVPPR
jgi:hypothetical protein